jgi:nucleotide sugar dehydrogenase|tara:strand:+ start:42734 stop:43576 length:843 start_codon:yes stop_codon:yes gene_type:complete
MHSVIGIVGQGFVGTAIKEGLQHLFQIETYDKFKKHLSTSKSIEDLCSKTKLIFVCLPTPMKKSGSCDLSLIENTIEKIDSISESHIAIIKSTIPPGTTKKLNRKCNDLQVVFNPEFLTEANYIDDFKNQNRIIIGGPRPATTIVKNLYRKAFQRTPIVKTGSDTAEMVKYFTNCFLALKVSFANEIKQICDSQKIDFDKVLEYSLYDQRIGNTHLSVPGPDGKDGFGGSCFPKDLNALIHFAVDNEIEPIMLSAIWNKNLEVRPEKDWEMLKGRAISDE